MPNRHMVVLDATMTEAASPGCAAHHKKRMRALLFSLNPITDGTYVRSALFHHAVRCIPGQHLHRLRASMLQPSASAGDSNERDALRSVEAFLELCQQFHVSPLTAHRLAVAFSDAATTSRDMTIEDQDGEQHQGTHHDDPTRIPPGVVLPSIAAPSDSVALLVFLRMVEHELRHSVRPDVFGDYSADHGVDVPLSFPLGIEVGILLFATLAYFQSRTPPIGSEAVELLRSFFDSCAVTTAAQQQEALGSLLPRETSDSPLAPRVTWSALQRCLSDMVDASSADQHRHTASHGKSLQHESSWVDVRRDSARALPELRALLLDALGNPEGTGAESSQSSPASVTRRQSRPDPVERSFTFSEFLDHLRDVSFADARLRRRLLSKRRLSQQSTWDASQSENSTNGSPTQKRVSDAFPQALPGDTLFATAARNRVFEVDVAGGEDDLLRPLRGDELAVIHETSFDMSYGDDEDTTVESALIDNGMLCFAPLGRASQQRVDSASVFLSAVPPVDVLSSSHMSGSRTPIAGNVPVSILATPLEGGLQGHNADTPTGRSNPAKRKGTLAQRKGHKGNSPGLFSPTQALHEKLDKVARHVGSTRSATDAKMSKFAECVKSGLQVMLPGGESRPPTASSIERRRRPQVRDAYAPSMIRRHEAQLAEMLEDYNVDHEMDRLESKRRQESREAKVKVRELQRRRRKDEERRVQEETSKTHSLVAREEALVAALSDAMNRSTTNHILHRKAVHALDVLLGVSLGSHSTDTMDTRGHRPLPTPSPGPGASAPPPRRLLVPHLNSSDLGITEDCAHDPNFGTPGKKTAFESSRNALPCPRESNDGRYELSVIADGVGSLRCELIDVYSLADLVEALDDLLAPYQQAPCTIKHRRRSSTPYTPVARKSVVDVFVALPCPASNMTFSSSQRFVPLASIEDLPRTANVKVLMA